MPVCLNCDAEFYKENSATVVVLLTGLESFFVELLSVVILCSGMVNIILSTFLYSSYSFSSLLYLVVIGITMFDLFSSEILVVKGFI